MPLWTEVILVLVLRPAALGFARMMNEHVSYFTDELAAENISRGDRHETSNSNLWMIVT